MDKRLPAMQVDNAILQRDANITVVLHEQEGKAKDILARSRSVTAKPKESTAPQHRTESPEANPAPSLVTHRQDKAAAAAASGENTSRRVGVREKEGRGRVFWAPAEPREKPEEAPPATAGG